MAPHSYHLPDDHLQPPQHHPHHNQHQQQQQQSMQPPPSPSIPIDPALALYPPTYYPQYHNTQMPQQLSLGASLSSPSSQASEAVSTPPTEQMSAFAGPSKRPASAATNDGGESSQKRMRADEDAAGDEPKTKPTRGSRWVHSCACQWLR
ncbi:hypothetical protein EWM64_g7757 [Hericium alpestre]|uniref:Uncharacterized protein n=1 Tax=Hericium alpestre TaxID=135208 RepID=A0A4Y9ZN82_9AGAM|nr:hypothetical protein EWM64_g7757 [Hericium alpestre]